jgi:hypothetical protein
MLAVLFVVTQASVPVPGQAAKSAAQSSGKTDSKGQNANSHCAPSVPLGKPNNATTSDLCAAKPAPDDKESSVKLTSLPPVTLADEEMTVDDYFSIRDRGCSACSWLSRAVGNSNC